MHEARFLFFLHISFFFTPSTRASPPFLLLATSRTLSPACPLRARHYGQHPESTGTTEYKAKGEAERESQKRGNRRQVIPRRKLVKRRAAGTNFSADRKTTATPERGIGRE